MFLLLIICFFGLIYHLQGETFRSHGPDTTAEDLGYIDEGWFMFSQTF